MDLKIYLTSGETGILISYFRSIMFFLVILGYFPSKGKVPWSIAKRVTPKHHTSIFYARY